MRDLPDHNTEDPKKSRRAWNCEPDESSAHNPDEHVQNDEWPSQVCPIRVDTLDKPDDNGSN